MNLMTSQTSVLEKESLTWRGEPAGLLVFCSLLTFFAWIMSLCLKNASPDLLDAQLKLLFPCNKKFLFPLQPIIGISLSISTWWNSEPSPRGR